MTIRTQDRRKKALFYRKDPADSKGYILAVANWRRSCSLRKFDADTGVFVPPSKVEHGYNYASGRIDYETAFRNDLQGAVEIQVGAAVLSQLSFKRSEEHGMLPPWALDDIRAVS